MEIQTDAMTISLPTPADPPIIYTIRLGVMAMHLVTKFLSHFLIFKSKKPYSSNKYSVTLNIIQKVN